MAAVTSLANAPRRVAIGQLQMHWSIEANLAAMLRCTAVICREVEDLDAVSQQLPHGAAQLVFWPGLMGPEPDAAPLDPPEHVQQAQRMAQRLGAWMVQANWPNALNYPERGATAGRSVVISPEGRVQIALPQAAPGVGIFELGSAALDWYPEDELPI